MLGWEVDSYCHPVPLDHSYLIASPEQTSELEMIKKVRATTYNASASNIDAMVRHICGLLLNVMRVRIVGVDCDRCLDELLSVCKKN
jgi:hypothetical protein